VLFGILYDVPVNTVGHQLYVKMFLDEAMISQVLKLPALYENRIFIYSALLDFIFHKTH